MDRRALGRLGEAHRLHLHQHARAAVGWYDDDAVYVPRAHITEAAGHVLGEQAIVKLLIGDDCLADRHSSKRAAVQWIKGVGRVTAYALRLDKFGPKAKP